MRHAEPLAPNEWHGSEATRPLSDRGMADLMMAVEAMQKQGFKLDAAFTSPLERAKQTAEQVVTAASGVVVVVRKELTSGTRHEAIRSVLNGVDGKSRVLMVGHMPDLSIFASILVGDPHLLEEGLKPGDIWAVGFGSLTADWGKARLLWKRGLLDWRGAMSPKHSP